MTALMARTAATVSHGVPGPVGAQFGCTAMAGGVEPVEVLPRGAEPMLRSERRRADGVAARTATVELLSDAVLVLPGGIDVLAMLLDLLTRRALEIGRKPCAVLDPGGLLDPLDRQLAVLEAAGDLTVPMLRDADPVQLADRLAAWRPVGLGTVRDEAAWMRVQGGGLSLLPLPDGQGLGLPSTIRGPAESGVAALRRWLEQYHQLRLSPERFRLVAALAVTGLDGALRRVSCYRVEGSTPLPGAVEQRLGERGGDPAAAALQDLLLRGAVAY